MDLLNEHYKKEFFDRNILNGLKKDAVIFRIFTIERFFEVVFEYELTTVKPRFWKDPFENFVANSIGITPDGDEVSLEKMRDLFYGQCWTKCEEEDWMWQMYAPFSNGVKVRTTVKKLFEQFYDFDNNSPQNSFFIGKVIYDSDANIRSHFENIGDFYEQLNEGNGEFLVRTLLVKRNNFEFEDEVRLIFCPMGDTGQNSKGINSWDSKKDLYKFKVAPFILFDEIIFDPRISDHLFQICLDALTKIGYDKAIIRKSGLYTFKQMIIKI